RVLLNYAPTELKPDLKRLLQKKKASYTLDYAQDRSLRRRLSLLRRKLSTLRYYPHFCGKKE
ncbi:MAG: carboxylate--amine ligase, partial [Clostridiaceae bacterium]|nr:carboxylate--amine ligase [Clostridiaceae bacterium]